MKNLIIIIILIIGIPLFAGNIIIPEHIPTKNYGGHGGGGDVDLEALVTVESLEKIEKNILRTIPMFFREIENSLHENSLDISQPYRAQMFLQAWILFNKKHPYDLTDYSKNTIFNEIKKLKGIAFQEEPCIDVDGRPKDATFFSKKGPDYICISAARLRDKNIINKIAFQVTSPLLAHELVHKKDKTFMGDSLATIIQNKIALNIRTLSYYEEKFKTTNGTISSIQYYFSSISDGLSKDSNSNMICSSLGRVVGFSRELYNQYFHIGKDRKFRFFSPVDELKLKESILELYYNIILACPQEKILSNLEGWYSENEVVEFIEAKQQLKKLRDKSQNVSYLELSIKDNEEDASEVPNWLKTPLRRKKMFFLANNKQELQQWTEDKLVFLSSLKTQIVSFLENGKSKWIRKSLGQLLKSLNSDNTYTNVDLGDANKECKVKLSYFYSKSQNVFPNTTYYLTDFYLDPNQSQGCRRLRSSVYNRMDSNQVLQINQKNYENLFFRMKNKR